MKALSGQTEKPLNSHRVWCLWLTEWNWQFGSLESQTQTFSSPIETEREWKRESKRESKRERGITGRGNIKVVLAGRKAAASAKASLTSFTDPPWHYKKSRSLKKHRKIDLEGQESQWSLCISPHGLGWCMIKVSISRRCCISPEAFVISFLAWTKKHLAKRSRSMQSHVCTLRGLNKILHPSSMTQTLLKWSVASR